MVLRMTYSFLGQVTDKTDCDKQKTGVQAGKFVSKQKTTAFQ